MVKVLVVATSKKTRGGITSVVKAHETGNQWKNFHCHWVQTHRDGPIWRKILYFVLGIIDFLIHLPFYQLVHIHTADYGTEKRKRIFARITKFFGKKLIIHLHSSDPQKSINGKYKDLYNFSLYHADKILVLSYTWKEEVLKNFHLPKDKIEILYNPCPKVEPSQIEERENYILFAGTLIIRKGYKDLINAFALISEKHPSWRLKLAGNGNIEEGKCLIKELGIENKVDFLGWVNGKEKDEVFRHSSIYCLPSYSEGFPMGVLDAWAYHLPVVTTPVGGLPDIVKDGVNSMIFTPGNIKELSEKLDRLISDKHLYKQISKESERLSETKFNISNINLKLEQIYKSLVKNG